jgi:hypothetical protein
MRGISTGVQLAFAGTARNARNVFPPDHSIRRLLDQERHS